MVTYRKPDQISQYINDSGDISHYQKVMNYEYRKVINTRVFNTERVRTNETWGWVGIGFKSMNS